MRWHDWIKPGAEEKPLGRGKDSEGLSLVKGQQGAAKWTRRPLGVRRGASMLQAGRLPVQVAGQ